MSKKLKNIVGVALTVLFLFVLAGTASAQQTIKGTVVDATGEPIIGATVKEPNSTNGAVTDLDGNFALTTNSKTVEVSYVGMKTQTINIQGKSTINVTLQDDSQGLNEIVVIGYGTVRKKDLTGAVASIGSDKLDGVPVSNVSEALTGKLAGVNITTTEGSPDADVKIRVRGGGSLSQDNSPLYIVDGFPVSSISDIAPSEIESIDVLKDASSTAIYGARGANGVIIVTTKSGKEGNVQVNFNASHGWKKITKEVKVLDPYNFAYYQYEGGVDRYGDFADLDIWKSVAGSDWQDEMFGRTGHQNTYNANVSGGTKELKFNVGYNHNDEKSIMLGSGFKKDNISAKINAELNKWLTLDFNARMAFTKLDGLNGGADTNDNNASNSLVGQTIGYAPINAVSDFTDDDTDEENSSSSRRSPYQRMEATYKFQERFQQSYNAGLSWRPFKHFTFRTELGYTWKYNNTDQVWVADATTNFSDGPGLPQSLFTKVNNQGWRNANTVTYDHKKLFGGKHHLNVLLGQEWSSTKQTTRSSKSIRYDKSMTIAEILANTDAGEALQNNGTIAAEENLLSFFGRVNYTIEDKYLATFTMRADGSSKFGSGNRWGVFPSLAVAWRMSEENFLKTVTWLDNLKLRLSWGTAGNNRINSGLISTVYSLTNSGKAPFFDEIRGKMLTHGTNLYNPNLKWETTVTRNVGIDYGFIRGRINGTLDFYWNTTKDLLMASRVPTNSGYSTQFQNFGTTSNKGIEFTLNAVILETQKAALNFNFNIAYNRSKIEKVSMDSPFVDYAYVGSKFSDNQNFRIEEGGRLGEVWGYKMNGFYTVYDPATGKGDLIYNPTSRAWEMANGEADNSYTLFGGLYPGVPKVKTDENGNPLKQRLGNTIAPTTGGFGFDGRVGNFDFNVFFNYSLGNKIVNGTKMANAFMSNGYWGWNIVDDFNINNRYTWIDPDNGLNLGKNPSATVYDVYGGVEGMMARLNELNQNANIYNPAAMTKGVLLDYAVEDASFLRLQNVTVGYTLPKSLMKRIFLERVRFYFTGYNLLCFTNYSGYDPEVDTSGKRNPMAPGIDYAAYPKSRTYVAGVNVTF